MGDVTELKRARTIDGTRYTRSIGARRLRGAAALMEMLEQIEAPKFPPKLYSEDLW